jgi:hypothetical protein
MVTVEAVSSPLSSMLENVEFSLQFAATELVVPSS